MFGTLVSEGFVVLEGSVDANIYEMSMFASYASGLAC